MGGGGAGNMNGGKSASMMAPSTVTEAPKPYARGEEEQARQNTAIKPAGDPTIDQVTKRPFPDAYYRQTGDGELKDIDEESGLTWTGKPQYPGHIDDWQPVSAKERQMPQQKYWPVRELRNPPEGQKKPERRYYVIGERILEGALAQGDKKHHAQFIANDGANIGHFPDGFHEDDRKNLHRYLYRDEKRYDADRLEQAMRIYAERIQDYRQEFKDAVKPEPSQYYTDNMPHVLTDYSLPFNNCQDYINDVLKIYYSLEKDYSE